MITRDAVALDSTMLDEARAYLRLETEEEDPSLGAILLSSIAHAEGFLNMMLIRRGVIELIPMQSDWTRLAVTPVAAITQLRGLPAEGAAFVLPLSSYAIDVDANGDGWVRVTQPGAAGRIEVTATAGLASAWETLPETIRLGVLRLTGHLHLHRDSSDDAGPPAAVAALLRPWRRMRLS